MLETSNCVKRFFLIDREAAFRGFFLFPGGSRAEVCSKDEAFSKMAVTEDTYSFRVGGQYSGCFFARMDALDDAVSGIHPTNLAALTV